MTRASETFAFEVIRRVTGCDVTPTDDGTRPGMVDGTWTDEQGNRHAVEVTRLMPSGMGQLLGLLNEQDYKFPASSLRYRWSSSVEPTVRLAALSVELEPMLLECESRGLRRLRDLPWSELDGRRLGPLVQAGDLDAWAMPERENPGYVEVLPPGRGGAAGGMDVVPPWLTEELGDEPLTRKVAKLRRWDAEVRHLFVGIHSYGVPFAVGYAFWDEGDVPDVPPLLPDGLDAVWLAPSIRRPPLTWLPGRGWERHDVLDGPELK